MNEWMIEEGFYDWGVFLVRFAWAVGGILVMSGLYINGFRYSRINYFIVVLNKRVQVN